MKKKLFGLMALIICACTAFTSCSDDDDSADNNIIGRWEQTGYKNWEEDTDGPFNKEEFDNMPTSPKRHPVTLVFKKDGKVDCYEFRDNELQYQGAYGYKVSGNKLILTDGDFSDEITIQKLTDSELTIFQSNPYEENGKTYMFYAVVTYKRIG